MKTLKFMGIDASTLVMKPQSNCIVTKVGCSETVQISCLGTAGAAHA